MYSTIIKKKCKCGCDKYPTFSCFGYNYACLPPDLKEKAGTRAKVARKNKNKRVALSKKLHIAQKEANGDWKLDLWFCAAAVELANKPFCMECGTFIPKNYYRHATAHILPKRKEFGFPSVAAHPKNRIFLCGINGCHDRTHVWSTFVTMKVWPKAVEIFKEIYPYIAANELKNIPNVLLETLL